MFGTDRAITEFSLRIYKIGEEGKERCKIWGGVSYTSEIDFRSETSPDTIEIRIFFSAVRFNKLAKLISTNKIDIVRMSLSNVSGFYSERSPSISTNNVKVLTRGSDQEVASPDGCNITPSRLGTVDKFDLMLINRCKLNPKQDLTTLNILKLFDDEFYDEENDIKEAEDPTKLLLSKISQNQIEIIKLKNPLWIIAFLLGVFILSAWF